MTGDVWTLPEGQELKYQDGDYVEIDLSSNPDAVFRLPFVSGYVRGYDALTVDGETSVTYSLFKVGNNVLNGVREDRLKKVPGQFGIAHGRGAHGDGRECALCGANL